ncbi:MAG: TlyA family RNA methyltransferase [Anaerolineae bacterium]|nr:TlyA family RNA methyltransferase [Anaerolineae bacterium]
MAQKIPKRVRLDLLLLERGLVESREIGRRLIMAGEVLVDDRPATKPGVSFRPDVDIRLRQQPRFVSRGGEKLAAALERFAIDPAGWVCADVGASTGGFTDCLLQAGAAKVYAIDVGYGQLAWTLREDARVIVMERTNARYIDVLPEIVDFVCVDASFISLGLLLPVAHDWLISRGQVVALVKPQFEAGKSKVGKGGVVRDPAVHRDVLFQVAESARRDGFAVLGIIPSPLRGPSGNIEFLMWLGLAPPADQNIDQWIEEAVSTAHEPL